MKKKFLILLMAGCMMLTACNTNNNNNTTTENALNSNRTQEQLDSYIDSYSQYVEVLGEYSGLEFEYVVPKATSAQINAEIDYFTSQHTTVKYIEDETYETQVNDKIFGTIQSYKDDVATEDVRYSNYLIGSNLVSKEFDEALIGKKINDSFEVEHDGLIIKVSINKIANSVPAEFTDELVQENTNFNTTDEYRKDIQNHLNEELEMQAKTQAQFDLFNTVANNSTFKDFPEEMITQAVDAVINETKANATSYSVTYEEYVKEVYQVDDVATFEAYIREMQILQLKETALICAIAKDANIQVTDQDKIDQVESLAGSQSSIAIDQVTSIYSEEDISIMVLRAKVLNYLFDNGIQK